MTNKISIKKLGPNQTLLRGPMFDVLFSYEIPVAGFITGDGYFRTKEKFSNTTTKHINKWLKENQAENVDVISQEEIYKILETP